MQSYQSREQNQSKSTSSHLLLPCVQTLLPPFSDSSLPYLFWGSCFLLGAVCWGCQPRCLNLFHSRGVHIGALGSLPCVRHLFCCNSLPCLFLASFSQPSFLFCKMPCSPLIVSIPVRLVINQFLTLVTMEPWINPKI
jgi:hypothetical protein